MLNFDAGAVFKPYLFFIEGRIMKAANFFLVLSISLPIVAQPRGQVFINAVVNQLLQVNQLRANNVIISGNLVVGGSILNGSTLNGGGSGESTSGVFSSLTVNPGPTNLSTVGNGTVTIGNSANTGAIAIEVGTGELNINGNGNPINIGNDNAANFITIGNTNANSAVSIEGGLGVAIYGLSTGGIILGADNSTGSILIGNSTVGQPISIGTDGANTINIGSTIVGSMTTISGDAFFIDGIVGVTVANDVPVLIDTTTGQLGTTPSSRRYKENIESMENGYSERIHNLKPVLFTYKKDAKKTKTWGLIAEQVQEVFPELVINDVEGNPLTVRYHELPVLLLNEVIKHKNSLKVCEKEIADLKLIIESLLNAHRNT